MAISWECTHVVESGGRGCSCKDLQRDLAQARADSARYRAALEHVIEHLDMRDDAEYIERLARTALEQI